MALLRLEETHIQKVTPGRNKTPTPQLSSKTDWVDMSLWREKTGQLPLVMILLWRLNDEYW